MVGSAGESRIDPVVRVLVADDEDESGEDLAGVLAGRGMQVFRATCAARCLAVLAQEPIDVALVSVQAKGEEGLDLVREIKRANPVIEVILLTGGGTVDLAVAGLKLGAFDFLVGRQDPGVLAAKVEEAARRKQRVQRELIDRDLGERMRRETT